MEIVRTVLVTEVENKITKEHRFIYGRYDPVTLERNQYKVVSTERRQYEMSDEDFVKHGKRKENNHGING